MEVKRQNKALARYLLDVVEAHIEKCVAADNLVGSDDYLHTLNKRTREFIQTIEGISSKATSINQPIEPDKIGPEMFSAMCDLRSQISHLGQDQSRSSARKVKERITKLERLRVAFRSLNNPPSAGAFIRYVANENDVKLDQEDLQRAGTLCLSTWGTVRVWRNEESGSLDLHELGKTGKIVKEDPKIRDRFVRLRNKVKSEKALGRKQTIKREEHANGTGRWDKNPAPVKLRCQSARDGGWRPNTDDNMATSESVRGRERT